MTSSKRRDDAPFPDGFADAILDALPDSTAVLDPEGVIVHTNAAWRSFGTENGLAESDAVGVDYLAVCDGTNDEHARQSAEGIRAVLTGERDDFELEYPCHGDENQ